MAPTLQKYHVYDPSLVAGDELGGLRVMDGDSGLHILASPMMVKYWIDQGMLGSDPLSKLSEGKKKFLAQVTRGRSESDDEPTRLPHYASSTQSGAPIFAGTPAAARRRAAAKQAKKAGKSTKKPDKTERKPIPPVAPV